MKRALRVVRWLVFVGVLLATFMVPTVAMAQNETVEYYAVDVVGSVRVVFSPGGTIVSRVDYGPFGEQISVSTLVPKAYAQLFRDGEAGVDYAQARSYQLRTGRFSAPDPLPGHIENPQSWNQYLLCLEHAAVCGRSHRDASTGLMRKCQYQR